MMHVKMLIVLISAISSLIAISCASEDLTSSIYDNVAQSVVTVYIYNETKHNQGSGFVANEFGDVITCYHLLELNNISHGKLMTFYGTEYNITGIVRSDPDSDILLLKTDLFEGVSFLPLSLRSPKIGESIIVIGSPLGQHFTASKGIVSAIRDDEIQIDAPISPGSSGGPVVNMDGEVIGIVKKFIPSGQNLNFLAPAEKIHQLLGWEIINESGVQIVLVPQTTTDRISRGKFYLSLDAFNDAANIFIEELLIDPSNKEAWALLGLVNYQVGLYEEAVKCCDQAINRTNKLDPLYGQAHIIKGYALLRLDLNTEAIQILKIAEELQPSNEYVINGLCSCYSAKNDYFGRLEYCASSAGFHPFYTPPLALPTNLEDLGKQPLSDVDYNFIDPIAKNVTQNNSENEPSKGLVVLTQPLSDVDYNFIDPIEKNITQNNSENEPSKELVVLTFYIADMIGNAIPGVQVEGRDSAGNSFCQLTNSNGSVIVTGTPGIWKFKLFKDNYKTECGYYQINSSIVLQTELWPILGANITECDDYDYNKSSGTQSLGQRLERNLTDIAQLIENTETYPTYTSEFGRRVSQL